MSGTSQAKDDDGYYPVLAAPENELLSVRWGTPPHCEYGVAKFVFGKWWNYTSRNPHAQGLECATPSGWTTYMFGSKSERSNR